MRLIIRGNAEAASLYVANYIIGRIKHFAPTPANPFVLGLPTGSSPLGVYRILVERYKAGEISFENVVTFNMDEYIGIPRDHPQSYHTFMWQHFFSHVNIHPRNVHILNGNAADPESECIRYEAQIKAAGGIDVFLAGIGEDGHIAFNEPGSSLASRTRVKTLAYDTVLANSRFFDHDTAKVPKMALTVGVQTVLEAREVVVVVLGARKASALQHCIEDGVNHMWTLSSLQLHPYSMIVCDEDATLELKVKTVKYFKSIEQVARAEGFEQTLPTSLRTTTLKKQPAPPTIVTSTNGDSTPTMVTHGFTTHTPPESDMESDSSPIIFAPQPTPSRFLLASSPAVEYPLRTSRSASPDLDLVPDRMAERIMGGEAFRGRLTPKPEVDLVPDRMAERIVGGEAFRGAVDSDT